MFLSADNPGSRTKASVVGIAALVCALATGGCSSATLGIAAAGMATQTVSSIADAARQDAQRTTLSEAARAIERSDMMTCKEKLREARAAAIPAKAAEGVRANVPAVAPMQADSVRECHVQRACVKGRSRPVSMMLCRSDRDNSPAPDPGYRLPKTPSSVTGRSWTWETEPDANSSLKAGSSGG